MIAIPHTLARLTLTTGLILAAAPSGLHAQTSVMFDGLRHTPIGNAALRLDTSADALEVSTFDPRGGDGVATALPESRSWSARLKATSNPGSGIAINWNAMADGRRISSASLHQAGTRFQLKATFSGATQSTYAAHVYNDGQLVGSLGRLPPTARTEFPIAEYCTLWYLDDRPECDDDGGGSIEFLVSGNGECEWRLILGARLPITLPNGTTLSGNEIRLVEEVRPGQYPYLTFDRMETKAVARQLTLLSEAAQ